MAEERKSWNSQMAEELIGEAIDRAVPGAEGSEDDTTMVEMLAARVEEVRLLNIDRRIGLNHNFPAQVTVSERAEVPEAEDLVLESTEPAARGLVVEDRDEGDRHEEVKLRKGGLLRDKAMASTTGVREIQVKLDTG